MKKGIDVSRWQSDIDWKKVKAAGIEFAIIQAGYGRELSQKDEKFEQNYSGCKSAGMPCGVYWYSYARTEADWSTRCSSTWRSLRCCGWARLRSPRSSGHSCAKWRRLAGLWGCIRQHIISGTTSRTTSSSATRSGWRTTVGGALRRRETRLQRQLWYVAEVQHRQRGRYLRQRGSGRVLHRLSGKDKG